MSQQCLLPPQGTVGSMVPVGGPEALSQVSLARGISPASRSDSDARPALTDEGRIWSGRQGNRGCRAQGGGVATACSRGAWRQDSDGGGGVCFLRPGRRDSDSVPAPPRSASQLRERLGCPTREHGAAPSCWSTVRFPSRTHYRDLALSTAPHSQSASLRPSVAMALSQFFFPSPSQ